MQDNLLGKSALFMSEDYNRRKFKRLVWRVAIIEQEILLFMDDHIKQYAGLIALHNDHYGYHSFDHRFSYACFNRNVISCVWQIV